MSDLNKTEQRQEETSFINDKIDNLTLKLYDENNSEYEDVEEDECDEIITSIATKSSLKTTTDEDELHINVKLRRRNTKHQDDEHSEGYEDDDDDDDHQNVPKINRDIKKSNKNKELLDDDNNTQSPAYIPRKGKYYEHDDRTLDENDRSKQEISRNENRYYRDSDAKWQHDLYFRDEQISKPRYSIPRRDHDRFERHHNYDRKQLHLTDYMPRSQKGRSHYHQQQYYNDYRPQVPREPVNKTHNGRINNFDFKDYDRSLSSNRHDYNRDTNIHKETQVAPRQQRRDYDPYQIDERTFHRRRKFANNQFQQNDNVSKFDNHFSNRNDRGRLDKQSKENNRFKDNNEYRNYEGKPQQQNQGLKNYELYENKNNLPPRFQINNNYRNLTQKQQYQQNTISTLSINESNIERPKRYSNMRNNTTNPVQQQTSSSQIQHSNNVEQNDWPQAPPPPTSYLPQQIITSQMYYPQQTSRYVPINYSQASISEQVKKKFCLV